LNLLLGFSGLLSFGHAMFFGAGAYTTALLLSHIDGLPFLGAVLIGGLAAGLFALCISPLLVRVGGASFAMMTLAFGQLMYVFCLKFRNITGGEDGIAGFPIPALTIPGILSVDMTASSNFYFFTLAIVALALFLLWFFTKTPLGCVMVGIRDNAMRVAYLGYRVPQTKAVIFIISGIFAGLAGSIYTVFNNLVSPDDALSLNMSIYPVMMAFIGGTGSFFGPMVGAGILQVIDELATRYTERIELVNGIIFISAVLYAPLGAVGIIRKIKEKASSHSKALLDAEIS